MRKKRRKIEESHIEEKKKKRRKNAGQDTCFSPSAKIQSTSLSRKMFKSEIQARQDSL